MPEIIVFDMDNTLADELGATLRPGIVDVLERLRADGHTHVLWTSSGRERAMDIRRIRGDVLVDDDPDAVELVRSTGRRGGAPDPSALQAILAAAGTIRGRP